MMKDNNNKFLPATPWLHAWLAGSLLAAAACGVNGEPDDALLGAATGVAAISPGCLQERDISFNASVVEHEGLQLLGYRVQRPQKKGRRIKHSQHLALVALDQNQQPLATPIELVTPHEPGQLPSAEDPRLFEHQEQLYVAYNAEDLLRPEGVHGSGVSRRMFLGHIEIAKDANTLRGAKLKWSRQIDVPRDQLGLQHWEKNWTPFSQDGAIHLIYRTNPPLVLRVPPQQLAAAHAATDGAAAHDGLRLGCEANGPVQRNFLCAPVSSRSTQAKLPSPSGNWRGGTPAMYDAQRDLFLSFYHTQCKNCRIGANRRQKYYWVGAYAFSPRPPFDIVQYTPAGPLPEIDDAPLGTTRISFVQGFTDAHERYTISFGRDDVGIGMASLDKEALWASMRSVVAGCDDAQTSQDGNATSNTEHVW